MALTLNILEHAPAGAEAAAPLVIAHGLFGSARNFNSLGRKLATDRRVLMVDMRNHGESPWDEDVSYRAMAGDLAGVIRTACGGRAVVLGHSMGGKATMALALSAPELLDGIIVADIAPVAYSHTHLPFVQAMRAMDLGQVARRSDADPMLAGAVENPMLRAFLLQNLRLDGGQASWRLNLAALESGMDQLVDWPDAFADRRYDGPAFFLYGGASEHMKKDFEGTVRESFPNAGFEAIPGAGHWLHAEQPEAFVAAVQGWLDRTEI